MFRSDNLNRLEESLTGSNLRLSELLTEQHKIQLRLEGLKRLKLSVCSRFYLYCSESETSHKQKRIISNTNESTQGDIHDLPAFCKFNPDGTLSPIDSHDENSDAGKTVSAERNKIIGRAGNNN